MIVDYDPESLRPILEAETALGQPDRSVRGHEVDYWCPFCLKRGYGHQSHIHVNYRKGLAICHQCGGWKSLLSLVRALYGTVPSSVMRAQMHGDLVESLRSMLRKTAGDVAQTEEAAPALPAEFVPFGDTPPREGLGVLVWQYLTGPRDQHNRGLPPEFLSEIGAGYCAEGRYKGYAIFPIHVAGELVTFTSRRVIGTDSKVQHGSAAASRHAVFNYDPVLAAACERVFVGEGPFDGWAFHRRTGPSDGGVGLLGKVLHDEQCRLLARLPCQELVMCLDDTEHAKTRAGAAKLSRFCAGTGKRVSYILLEPGSGDPHKNHRYLPWYIKRRIPYDPVMTELQGLLS